MSHHLIAAYQIIHNENVTLKGSTTITDNTITFRSENSKIPYLKLVKDNKSGHYKIENVTDHH